MAALLAVDVESWRRELPQIEEHYEFIGERLPDELRDELRELEKRLASAS
ncbi:MAG: phosphoenolpyruvate carboxykinase domain-containing protein [Acidimicrobiales bacterium]